MSGNFLENVYGNIVGNFLANNEIGFIYSHTRGYNHINDIATKEKTKEGGYKTKRIGAVYERFSECEHDIQAWIDEGKKLGYRKIVLFGHSLGCNKVLYYLHKNKEDMVVGLVLASPPDMVGLAKKPDYQPNYQELLDEAERNISDGRPEKLLSSNLWDWYTLSSQTFLDLCKDGCPADNLPIMRNPDSFSELESVSIPILVIVGEHDDIAITSLKEDLNLLESRATSCPSFSQTLIPGADHSYSDKEKVFAREILDWTRKLS